jgi:hypothetical protein
MVLGPFGVVSLMWLTKSPTRLPQLPSNPPLDA